MAKTALDLTAEERRSYRPARASQGEQGAARWERAWEVARIAARLLREQFGAQRVAAFGSLTHRIWFTSRSDIDLAAWGIPPHQYYRAVAAVTGLSADFTVDLIDPDACRPGLRQHIEREGIDL